MNNNFLKSQNLLRCLWCWLLMFVLQADVLSQNRLDSIHAVYDSIPLKFFPSGILHNRSLYYAMSQDSSYHPNPYHFTGMSDSPICTLDEFRKLEKDLYFAAIDSTRIWPPTSQRFYDSLVSSRHEIPLKVMHMHFHRLKEFAVDSGLVVFDSLRKYYLPIRDTNWVDKSRILFVYKENADSLGHLAFERHALFALTCLKPIIEFEKADFEVEFILHAASIIENIMLITNSIEVDFDDGLGWRDLPIQSSAIINYRVKPTCLNDEYQKHIRIRFHYIDSVFESSTYLMLRPSEQLKQESLSKEVTISPNPSRGQISLHFECPVENGRLRMFTSGGKEIYEDQIQDDSVEHLLDLQTNPGVYFIELNSDSHHQVILKWVII